MKTQNRFMDSIKSNYLVLIIALLGVLAFLAAVLIAWPALVYFCSRLFN